ncbi:hypothetical protein BGX23_004804, partial [Mortierella sp. AD031]
AHPLFKMNKATNTLSTSADQPASHPRKATVAHKKAVDDREYIKAHGFEFKNQGKTARENHSRHPNQETLDRDNLWKCGFRGRQPIR